MPWTDEQARLTQEARLHIASPEEVYRELQQIPQNARFELLVRNDEIEAALVERNEPLINLGLACYGTNKEVFKALFQHALGAPRDKADAQYRRGLRIGCLSNGSVPAAHFVFDFPRELIGEAEMHRVLANGESAEVEALLCNPSLSDEMLEELYQHTGAFAPIPEERWRNLVYVSRKNERLGREEDTDDSPDMGHFRIHKAIFRLLEIAPLEKRWLHVLHGLLDQLDFQQVAHPETIENVLARWAQLDDKGHDDKPIEGYFTSLSLKDEFRCLVASLYGRTYSNNKSTVQGGPTASDVAMRCAYYGNAELSAKELKAGYDRDREVFVFAAMNNNNLISKGTLRKTFEEDMVGGDLTRRYLRNFDLKKKKWPQIESYLSRELREDVARNKEDTRIEGIQTVVTGVEQRLAAIGEQLRKSQQLIIVAAIALAIVLYFRH
jgi:hypothetical protein